MLNAEDVVIFSIWRCNTGARARCAQANRGKPRVKTTLKTPAEKNAISKIAFLSAGLFLYSNNHQEADTLVWVHAVLCGYSKVLIRILSPLQMISSKKSHVMIMLTANNSSSLTSNLVNMTDSLYDFLSFPHEFSSSAINRHWATPSQHLIKGCGTLSIDSVPTFKIYF